MIGYGGSTPITDDSWRQLRGVSLSGRGQWAANSGAGQTVKMFNRCAPFNRSALFFRHFERLKRLERFEPSVRSSVHSVCDALSWCGE